jgi:hypothetical protein
MPSDFSRKIAVGILGISSFLQKLSPVSRLLKVTWVFV